MVPDSFLQQCGSLLGVDPIAVVTVWQQCGSVPLYPMPKRVSWQDRLNCHVCMQPTPSFTTLALAQRKKDHRLSPPRAALCLLREI